MNLDKILTKKFKSQIAGYDALEVDQFLDDVSDYIRYLEDKVESNIHNIAELKKRNTELQSTIEILKIENSTFKK